MAEEATKAPLDDSKNRLREAKDQRRIAKGHLSKAKQDLVEVLREYPEKIATAKNTLWRARETLREKRKERKRLARRRRTLHRQRRRNEAAQAKLDARIEKQQHAEPKIKARVKEDEERLERLPREGRVRLMLCRLLKVKIAYLEWRSARTRQTTKRLKEGTGQLDGSRSRIEDELKDVKNELEVSEQQEQAAIEDVEKKRKELDTLTDARKKEEEQAKNHIRTARENVREKRRAVWGAASRVNSEALKFPWKRVADNIVVFGKWAGFAGVTGCFYAYAVALGAIYQYFYFDSTGINIFSYAEAIDFLASGYSLAAFFILTTGLVALIPLVFYHLVKLILILPLPLYAEILAAVLPRFTKWVPKTPLFVLCCTVWVLFPLPSSAWLGYIWPPSQDVVWIVTDSPFQNEEKYVRVGSTRKYLFLKKFDEKKGQADGQTSSRKNPRPQVIMARLGTIAAPLQTTQTKDSDGAEPPKPNTADGKSDAGILVVPLSQITCIGETTGNGEGLCRPAAVKSPPPAEDPVDQHIANDMGCCPGKLDKSIFFSFVHDKGKVMNESQEQIPTLEKVWKEKIREFVARWNGKAAKWRVYGFASLDGLSADNDKLSLERAETVKKMMCDLSETSNGIENCPEKVEIRYLGENHLVTAGAKSQSAIIAVCERVPEQNPGKTATPAEEQVLSSG